MAGMVTRGGLHFGAVLSNRSQAERVWLPLPLCCTPASGLGPNTLDPPSAAVTYVLHLLTRRKKRPAAGEPDVRTMLLDTARWAAFLGSFSGGAVSCWLGRVLQGARATQLAMACHGKKSSRRGASPPRLPTEVAACCWKRLLIRLSTCHAAHHGCRRHLRDSRRGDCVPGRAAPHAGMAGHGSRCAQCMSDCNMLAAMPTLLLQCFRTSQWGLP